MSQTLLPKLRRPDWHRADEAWSRPLLTNAPAGTIPQVTLAYDLGDRLGTILKDEVAKNGADPAALEAEARKNLEARPLE